MAPFCLYKKPCRYWYLLVKICIENININLIIILGKPQKNPSLRARPLGPNPPPPTPPLRAQWPSKLFLVLKISSLMLSSMPRPHPLLMTWPLVEEPLLRLPLFNRISRKRLFFLTFGWYLILKFAKSILKSAICEPIMINKNYIKKHCF